MLERHLVDVPEPSSILKDGGLENLHRAFFCGEPFVIILQNQEKEIRFQSQSGDDIPSFVPHDAPKYPIIMRKEMTWRDLLAYFRTWSSLHTFHERFPEDKTHVEDTRFLEADLAIGSGAGRKRTFFFL